MTPKNGSILMWRNKKGDSWAFNLVMNSIELVTGSPYVHIAIVLFNKVFDYGVWMEGKKFCHGLRRRDYTDEIGDELYEPTFELSEDDYRRMRDYCIWLNDIADSYSFLKLFSLAIVYPFRKIFRALNWVPFDGKKFGDVCSVLPAEAYEKVNIDMFPNDHSGYTTPGMWMTLVPSKFTKTER